MAIQNLKNESGRSMVEMLGTLAIIGVLSIGGIVGYSYGMDKYRANQTINDIMLMAVDMITQTSQKRGVPTLAEWGTKTTAGYNVTVTSNPDNNTQYGIQITGVPSRVCQMVGDALKNQATVYVGNAERNDTTASDPCESSDSNSMEFYFEPVETAFECDPECPSGEFCRWGECVSEDIEFTPKVGGTCTSTSDCMVDSAGNKYTDRSCAACADGYCAALASTNGQSCTLSDGTPGQCASGQCKAKTGCTSNDNCTGNKEYCASPNTSCEEAFPSGETGTCVKADFKPITVEGKEYWVSNTSISWWDADAGCKALGKDLVSIHNLITGWAGEDDQNSHPKTPFGETLYGKLGNYYVWTSDNYVSCYAFRVDLSVGEVHDGHAGVNYYKNHNYNSFAVCH